MESIVDMNSVVEDRKHIIQLKYATGENPSKNYILNLLNCHITALNPERSLDAGNGRLRNFWMFPGRYVGIGLIRSDYFEGLRWKPNAKAIEVTGRMPEAYLMRLESDFSFLGAFELCVCTFAITQIQTQSVRVNVVRRLIERVDKGGSMILDGWIKDLDLYMAYIGASFDSVDLIYWGLEECNRLYPGIKREDLEVLSTKEMNAPNTPDGYERFYLLATGKKEAATNPGIRPDILDDNGLNIVKADMPLLILDSES